MTCQLSIIVFTRDDEAHLARCLECLEADPPDLPFEVVVVDNASKDATVPMLERFEQSLKIHLVQLTQDSAFSVGNNLGLARSSGRHVLFLNPDTLPSKEAIEACLEAVSTESSIGLASPRLRYPDGAPQPTGWHLPLPGQLVAERLGAATREVSPSGDDTTDVGWLMGCFLLGRREVFEELGGFDEDFWFAATDLELCARVRGVGLRVVRVEGVELVHVGHRTWDSVRRQESQRALAQWLRRDVGLVAEKAVAAASSLVEAWRPRGVLGS